MSVGVIIYGYYTAFKKTILPDVVALPLQITPNWFAKTFKGEQQYNALVHFDLIRAYKMYHFCYIPVFWKREFYLYNPQLKVFYGIKEELEEALKDCRDNNEEYHRVLSKFFKKGKK